MVSNKEKELIEEIGAVLKTRFINLDEEIENLKARVKELEDSKLDIYKKLWDLLPIYPAYPQPTIWAPNTTPNNPFNPLVVTCETGKANAT